jgi:aryl-alcohol dehydrogenase-like predicted oxidoreductase
MDYERLGTSGLRISRLCLGTMMFGGPTDEATSQRIIASARDAGVNFIDTADAYNSGRSEMVVGRAIRSDRDSWVVATKVFNPMRARGAKGFGPNRGGLSAKWIIEATHASLRRLGTDYLDIQYLHKEDHDTPLEETVRAMGNLIAQGKIRYFGVSNYRAWRIAEIVRLCDSLGMARPLVSQPYYNAMNRMPEVEELPVCNHYGIGVVPYSPLARGVLTGKYAADSPPDAQSRAGRQDKRMLQTEWRDESLEIAQAFVARASAKGCTAGQLAVAWVLNNKLISAAIAGPRTEAQWEDYLGAMSVKIDAQDEALVDERVTPGHPSTPGYNDPQYPIEGRIPR